MSFAILTTEKINVLSKEEQARVDAEAKAEAQRKASAAMHAAIIAKFATKHEVELHTSGMLHKVDGINVSVFVNTSCSTWRGPGKKTLRLEVGYDLKTNYPTNKAGEFNLAKIAAKIEEQVAIQREAKERELRAKQQRTKGVLIMRSIATSMGKKPYSDCATECELVPGVEISATHGSVALKLRGLDEAKAQAILKALTDANLL